MTAAALLDELRTKGVQLSVEGEQLAVDAPRGLLTAALRQAIRQHKTVLLALLAPLMQAADRVQPIAPTLPAPLTSHYPCAVCEGTDRWHDRGIWRCRRCWPPGSLAKQRAAAQEDVQHRSA